uniref:RING-type domain-containing protein n=1 Tax=Dendroctonus ponderosae TaxID=77166 RepID=A0AAR5PHM6_DENPD
MELPASKPEKIWLNEINEYLTCYLCKGYFIDATTISECLHSFCRSCIIKFLQDKSYCPVCELIINKAKPNLKLDKTRQDIVYKLVPQLFFKEMLRRKTLYKNHPEIAAKVSPEERGEDIERTIFNPEEMISLSLEYIRDDSTPGAIRIPGIVTELDTLKNNGSTEEGQDPQMKRYLLCPGMCRIEVLKKFIRNKYNVDTNQFFIDVLYKRVPLPDHYTLIDIAYIYSWQRNELMKFFFRIIDHNKPKPTDNPATVLAVPQFTLRHSRKTKSTGERTKRYSQYLSKKSHRKTIGKVSNSSSKAPDEHEIKKEIKFDNGNNDFAVVQGCDDAKVNPVESDALGVREFQSRASPTKEKVKQEKHGDERHANAAVIDRNNAAVVNKTDKENYLSNRVPKGEVFGGKPDIVTTNTLSGNINSLVSKVENIGSKNIALRKSMASHKHIFEESSVTVKKEPEFEETDNNKFVFKISREYLDDSNRDSSQSQVISKPVTKSYTSITLNRSENVEIITEIEPVSNRNGKSIGHHIIKQTIKKGSKVKSSNSPKKLPIAKLRITKSPVAKKSTSKRGSKQAISDTPAAISEAPKIESAQASSSASTSQVLESHSNSDNSRKQLQLHLSDEQFNFFGYLNLFPKASREKTTENVLQPSSTLIKNETTEPTTSAEPTNQQPKKQIIISRLSHGQKRKSTSPVKADRSKVLNLDTKKAIQLFLQGKSPSPSTSDNDEGLQSLINTCKIPSSLSITIKQSSEGDSSPVIVPPVKNYIEILKLPDELSNSDKSNISEKDKSNEPAKLDLSKFCDNDSEQKVDEDISEIAKSLTEKIPMSTTISEIVAPKPNFEIPVKTNIPSKAPIQPTPVPEVNKALGLTTSSKDPLSQSKPRSSQTFQKIFEESLKKPGDCSKVATIELSTSEESDSSGTATNQTSGKRKILELASQLAKTTKLDPEPNSNASSMPKVQIPRLSSWRHHKTLKHQPGSSMVAQTVASLHSSSLGMNYTVSVGPQNTSKVLKASGIVSPVKTNSVPAAPEQKPSDLSEGKLANVDFKVPSPSLSSPKLPDAAGSGCSTATPKTSSPKHSPKSSPLIKHMYASAFNQRVPSPKSRFSSNKNRVLKPKSSSTSPKPSTSVPSAKSPAPILPISTESDNPAAIIGANEIVDQYTTQVLKNNINLDPVLAGKQLAAFQHAFLLNQIEMRHRQNWYNRNQGHLLQYEKYLQSMNGGINGTQGQT